MPGTPRMVPCPFNAFSLPPPPPLPPFTRPQLGKTRVIKPRQKCAAPRSPPLPPPLLHIAVARLPSSPGSRARLVHYPAPCLLFLHPVEIDLLQDRRCYALLPGTSSPLIFGRSQFVSVDACEFFFPLRCFLLLEGLWLNGDGYVNTIRIVVNILIDSMRKILFSSPIRID